MFTAVVLPLVVVLLVLTRVLGGDDAEPVADVGGTPVPERADLPPLPVEAPPIPPEAEAPCESLLGELPLELAGEQSRRVDSDSPYVYAWGEPPVVLRCGTERPAELGPTSPLIVVNGVSWLPLATPQGALATTYAVVDRGVYLELSAPAETGPGPLQAVSDAVVDTLPPQPVRVR